MYVDLYVVCMCVYLFICAYMCMYQITYVCLFMAVLQISHTASRTGVQACRTMSYHLVACSEMKLEVTPCCCLRFIAMFPKLTCSPDLYLI